MSIPSRPYFSELQLHCNNKLIVEAKVERRNSGGYTVQVLGYEGFLPGSHSLVKMAVVSVEEDKLVGTTVGIVIIEISQSPFKLVVSRKIAKEVQAEQIAREKLARQIAKQAEQESLLNRRTEEIKTLILGDIIEGHVLYNGDGFTIVRAGSLNARINKLELGWGDIPYPEPGHILQIVITRIDLDRLALEASVRLLSPNPWLDADKLFPKGKSILARIKNVVKFGLFAELRPGVDCLVHRSAIIGCVPETDLDVHFNVGDQIPIVIEQVSTDQRKISARCAIELEQWKTLSLFQQRLFESQREVVALEDRFTSLSIENQRLSEAFDIQKQEDEYKIECLTTDLQNANAQLTTAKRATHEQLESLKLQHQQSLDAEVRLRQQLRMKLATVEKQLDAEKEARNLASEAHRNELTKQGKKLKEVQGQLDQAKEQLGTQIETPEPTTWAPEELTQVAAPYTENTVASLPVFITFSNSKQITNAIEFDKLNLSGEVYPVNFPYLNTLERQQLLAYKQLCEYPNHFLSSMADRVRKGSGNMLFASKAPAFHKTYSCEFALSNYINYSIPEEIKKRGKEAEEEFREWFAKKLEQNPRYMEKPLLMEPLMVECMQHFRLSSPPRPVNIPNSGLIPVDGQQLSVLEKQIEQVIINAAAFANSSDDHHKIIGRLGTHAYKGAKKNERVDHGTSLTDEEVRTILIKFDNNYKKVLITLLHTYYRSKFNNQLAFDGALLIAFGFRPCHACYTRADLNGITIHLPHTTPSSVLGTVTRATRSTLQYEEDDDNDLPF
ncbi:S1 RNA-binding domain-containing protein [Hymenobacter sp. GOD-10R]|uniref:S1 RNA-binding domain-containing protein n=1 Tax=Hymenobacter sp. GOD-10R TaxID=3093922 RepID=UPI002D77202E|nr:S1 RNA-binding domain-containing protein [Hymenobacter sp. GOD-10R]WRQ32013.1 S1 RNA-binding domain-containing protein [Hymenobacter sp. GOD-10R]